MTQMTDAAVDSKTVEVDKTHFAAVVDMHQRVVECRARYNAAKSDAKDKKQALEQAQETFETAFRRLTQVPTELPLFANQSEALEAAQADPVVTKLCDRLIDAGCDVNILIVAGYTEAERNEASAWLDACDEVNARNGAETVEADHVPEVLPEPPAFLRPQPLSGFEVAGLIMALNQAGRAADAETIGAWTRAAVAEVRHWLSAVESVEAAKGADLVFDDLPPMPVWLEACTAAVEVEASARADEDDEDASENDGPGDDVLDTDTGGEGDATGVR